MPEPTEPTTIKGLTTTRVPAKPPAPAAKAAKPAPAKLAKADEPELTEEELAEAEAAARNREMYLRSWPLDGPEELR